MNFRDDLDFRIEQSRAAEFNEYLREVAWRYDPEKEQRNAEESAKCKKPTENERRTFDSSSVCRNR